jgi:flavin-dependent dehydrogenase
MPPEEPPPSLVTSVLDVAALILFAASHPYSIFRLLNKRWVVEAYKTGILDRISGDSWIAIGDAASMVDPLSSAGVLKALKSAIEGADRIVECLAGNPFALANYEIMTRNDFDAYPRTRWHQYAIESRWSQRAFWARRRSAGL